MARPTRRTIASGISSWDADVDANFATITDAPFPIFKVDTVGQLPPANQFDFCVAIVGDVLYVSNGTSWGEYTPEAPSIATFVDDSVATTPGEMATDFNSLLSSLKTAGIMAT